jgi:hypothetical protein
MEKASFTDYKFETLNIDGALYRVPVQSSARQGKILVNSTPQQQMAAKPQLSKS